MVKMDFSIDEIYEHLNYFACKRRGNTRPKVGLFSCFVLQVKFKFISFEF